MLEIICISKVISAGDMSDIHSQGELLAPSHCPRALGVTHRWLWDSSRLRGLLGFGFGWSSFTRMGCLQHAALAAKIWNRPLTFSLKLRYFLPHFEFQVQKYEIIAVPIPIFPLKSTRPRGERFMSDTPTASPGSETHQDSSRDLTFTWRTGISRVTTGSI